MHGESYVYQLIGVIDLRFGMNLRPEVSVMLKKLQEGCFRDRNPSLIIWIFLLQIHDLEHTGVGEEFCGALKINHTQVVRGLENKIEPQTRNIWNHIYRDLFESPRHLEGGDAGFDIRLGIGLPPLSATQRHAKVRHRDGDWQSGRR